MNRGDLKRLLRVPDRQPELEVNKQEFTALITWILEVNGGRFCCRRGEILSIMEEMPPDIELSFERNWGSIVRYLEATERVLLRAISSLELDDWEALRSALFAWLCLGISSVPLLFENQDGGGDFLWYLGLVGAGITAHTDDGSWSWVWIEERGLECWMDESPVVN